MRFAEPPRATGRDREARLRQSVCPNVLTAPLPVTTFSLQFGIYVCCAVCVHRVLLNAPQCLAHVAALGVCSEVIRGQCQ